MKCGGGEDNHGFWYTEDGGASWNNVRKTPEEGKICYGGAVGISADGKTFFWAPENSAKMFYTTDKGSTWSECEGVYGVERISGDGVNPDLIYASSASKFYYSKDGGKTFASNWDISIFSATRPIVDPFIEGKLYLAAMGLQVSTDGGETFTRINTVKNCRAVGLGRGMNDDDPCVIYIWGQPTNDDELGLYWSTDEGASWSRINDSNHQYGGPGNGYFVYGDFNVYGRVYMSTVGMGVIVGDLVE